MSGSVDKPKELYKGWKDSGKSIVSILTLKLMLPALVAIISAIITAIITVEYVKQKPEISSDITWNSGKWEVPPGRIKLVIKRDRTPFVIMSVRNGGRGPSKNLHIELQLVKNRFAASKKPNPDKKYMPPGLRRQVVKSEVKQTTFYEKFQSFPGGDSLVQYTFLTDTFVRSKKHLLPTIMDDSMNWTPEVEFGGRIPEKVSVAPSFTSTSWAFGGEGDGGDSSDWAADDSIGGYRPVVMGQKMARLLLDEDLFTLDEYSSVQEIWNRRKHGAVFGGVDILTLATKILQILEDNQTISKSQSAHIMEKARSAGGILTMGYNIIILQVGILDALILNEKITLEEGQRIVDEAQVKSGSGVSRIH